MYMVYELVFVLGTPTALVSCIYIYYPDAMRFEQGVFGYWLKTEIESELKSS